MIKFEKLQQVKEMIMQLVFCWTMITSKIIMNLLYHYKMISIDLIKQQTLDGDPKANRKLYLLEM